MHDKILELVKERGPVLPSEISGELNIDSLLMNAYLSELAEQGKIKASKERVGTSFIYFVDGQEAAAEKKLADIKTQTVKTAAMYRKKSTPVTPEIEQKRLEFKERLERIEKEEKEIQKRVSGPRVDIIKKESPKPLRLAKQILRKTVTTLAKPEEKPSAAPETKTEAAAKKSPSLDKFIQMVQEYLRKKGLEVVTEVDKLSQKEAEFVANAPSPVGPVKFLVKIKRKKKINKTDLTLLYAEALERRMPAILLTDAELTTTGMNYLKELKGFVRIKQF